MSVIAFLASMEEHVRTKLEASIAHVKQDTPEFIVRQVENTPSPYKLKFSSIFFNVLLEYQFTYGAFKSHNQKKGLSLSLLLSQSYLLRVATS